MAKCYVIDSVNVVIDVVPNEIKEPPKQHQKIDKRQPLWDELDLLGIEYKKNLSYNNLQKLLKG